MQIMLDSLMIVLYQPPSQGRPDMHMHMLSVYERYTVTTCTKAGQSRETDNEFTSAFHCSIQWYMSQ